MEYRIRRGQVRGDVGPTKGKYARTAALPLDARAMLRAHRERIEREGWAGASEWVFPRPPFGRSRSPHWSLTTVTYKLGRSFARCGIDARAKTHVWRHTLVTLASGVASEQLLRKVVGHTSSSVHSKYRHAHDAEVIDLAEVIGRRLAGEKAGE